MFRYILHLLLLILSLALAALPFLPASLAGWLVLLSLAAIPLFILNIIVLLLSFLSSRSSSLKRRFAPSAQSRSRYLPVLSLLLLLPCMSNYLPINLFLEKSSPQAPANIPLPAENQLSLTLISFNADNFQLNTKTLHEFANLAHAQQADIICLQERPHDNLLRWDSIKAAFPDYPYAICNSREDEVLNLAFISRYPLVGMTERYYPKSYNKQLFTDIILGPDTIRLFNIHLQTTGLADNRARPRHAIRQLFDQAVLRNQQADDLVSDVQASPYPAIVVGDFNDTRAGYAYRRLRSYLRDANPHLSFTGSYQRFHSLYKIDHILCSSMFAPINYELIPNSWSDHKVQISRLSVKRTH